MPEWLIDLGISAILTSLKLAVKNTETKEKIRRAMLKIYTQIGIVFGTDEAFISVAVKNHKLS